jgi:diguanylate cyclase (GGDEF)-like protein
VEVTVQRRSGAKLFAVFAALALVPVLVLGFVLARQSQAEAEHRGLNQGRAEAQVFGRLVAETLLDGSPIRGSVSAAETERLRSFAEAELRRGDVVRLRVRDMDGRVIFAAPGVTAATLEDDEAALALIGQVPARVTRLNSDAGDSGPVGQRVAEVYTPLRNSDDAIIGVLEIYLPYAPIAADLSAGLGHLYADLAGGLLALYLALAGLAGWITRRLSRDAAAYEHLALHDSLTGLPNRTLFHERVRQALDPASGGPECAVVLIDLDRFKEVNDTLGHHNGDELLLALAGRLAEAARPMDTVARLGGDEFALVMTGVATAEEVREQLVPVLLAIEAEIELAGLPLAVEASIGVVLAPTDGVDPDLLLQRADVAMYVAKRTHAGVMFYDPAYDDYNSERLALVAELRRAVDRGELRLHYQPKASLPSRLPHAVEALMRWQHPTRGLLSPDQFIPVAEQTGLIEPLTAWLLDTALADLKAWADTLPELTMAVNVSARTLQRHDFPGVVLAALERSGIPPHRLLLEVTETALVTDPIRAAAVLNELSTMGIALSLDDFGSGYTSLGQLRSLPVNELKIDKSFVMAMMRSPGDAAIVRSVIELGHNLGMTVVAEGVETLETLEAVIEMGCDVAQGFWFSKPRAAGEIAEWLRTQWAAPAQLSAAADL